MPVENTFTNVSVSPLICRPEAIRKKQRQANAGAEYMVKGASPSGFKPRNRIDDESHLRSLWPTIVAAVLKKVRRMPKKLHNLWVAGSIPARSWQHDR